MLRRTILPLSGGEGEFITCARITSPKDVTLDKWIAQSIEVCLLHESRAGLPPHSSGHTPFSPRTLWPLRLLSNAFWDIVFYQLSPLLQLPCARRPLLRRPW